MSDTNIVQILGRDTESRVDKGVVEKVAGTYLPRASLSVCEI